MRSKKLVPLALLLAVAAAAAPSPAVAKPARKPCPARGAEARTLEARVYQRGQDDFELVGCHLRTRRRTVLAAWFSCGCSIGDAPDPQLWLRGRFAAVNQYSCSPIDPMQPCTGSLEVVDLRSGRVRHRADTGSLANLLLTRRGSVAYVLGQRLLRIDSRGAAVLADGPGIDAGSLAAAPGRLYWMQDGLARSASLR
jgi:hypothetical protein